MESFDQLLLAVFLVPATLVFLVSKCLFLAPTRGGWFLMFSNIVYETLFKRIHLTREKVDAALLLVVPVGWWLLAGPVVALGAGLVMGGAWAGALIADGRCKTATQFSHQHREYRRRVPLPVPHLIVQIRGPILRRGRVFDLGHWPVGLAQGFEVFVLNPSEIVPQLPLRVEVRAGAGRVQISGESDVTTDCPRPGEVRRAKITIAAPSAGAGDDIEVRVTHGDFEFYRVLRLRGVVDRNSVGVRGAWIRRWRFGADAAFAWRGDQDLYDPATFQSVEGLRITLGLAQRLRFPNTLFLSGRLSLVEEEHQQFCRHYGWDRHTGEIPDFARFLREEVDLSVEQEWPTVSGRPYSAELGNHMYLHYGTHAAAAPGNKWRSHATIGDGTYPWQQAGVRDSFSEQRDNAICNANLFERLLGLRPASYAIPSDVFDPDTPRAMEAAGMEVGSDTDASRFARVFGLPPPHHPAGCDRFVELTRKIPRDPDDAYKVAVLKYWLHAAARMLRAFIFLSHHHLLRYQGTACYHCTEELLRYVLEAGAGRCHVGTVTALGRYWRDVLSQRTRCVDVKVEGNRVRVQNRGSRTLTGLPVEVDVGGGRLLMTIVDVAAKSGVVVDIVPTNDARTPAGSNTAV